MKNFGVSLKETEKSSLCLDFRQSEDGFQFAAREMCGHSLASTVVHTLVMDTRDDPVIPKEGSRVALDQVMFADWTGLVTNSIPFC